MKKKLLISILPLLASILFVSCESQSPREKGVIKYAKENHFPIKANSIKNADPAILFCYSNHLYENGQKDEATFWYYVAQYRYRILSSCSEHLKAGSFSEDAAKDILLKTGVFESKEDLKKLHLIGGAYRIDLYETIQKKLGAKINGYAYGDLTQMKSIIDEMLEYNETNPFNPMGLEPKPILKSQDIQDEKLAKVKNSYIEQKKQMEDEADHIRTERAKNGLENR